MNEKSELKEIKWDVKKGYGIYSGIHTSQLTAWIQSGRIQKGEAFVWRSGFSGWRRPEWLPELSRFFRQKRRVKRKKLALRRRVVLHKRKIEKILVIDDEKEICWLLSDILRRKGYQVLTSTTGREGIGRAEKYRPDLVIMDLRLPDISGLKALMMLKRIDRTLPIAMISAYGTEEAVKQAKENGVFHFIHKPFTASKITRLVKSISK